MAIQQDIEIFSGNDILLEYSLTDEISGSPFDLTNVQDVSYALSRNAAGQPIVSKTIGNGVTVINAANGTLTVSISADETEPLSGNFYHELRVTNAAGKKLTVSYGAVLVKTNLIRN